MNLQHTNFKQRLRELLPGSSDLLDTVCGLLWMRCSLQTRELLNGSLPSFWRFPVPEGGWKTTFCLHYADYARICWLKYGHHLNEVCKLIYELTGVIEIYVRDREQCHRCYLKGCRWIREDVA